MSVAETELYPEERKPIKLFRAFPGGAAPSAVETSAALIVLGALLFLVAVRRGFRPVLAR